MKKVRVLVVQYKPIYLDIKANLEKIKRILRKYSFFKPQLVIFPEYALTGPLYGYYDLAFQDDNAVFKELSLLAKNFNLNLIPGSFVRKIGVKKYNSSCFINLEGKILDFYDKQYLWSSEKKFLEKGNKLTIFNTSLGKIVIQICADLHSSKLSDSYRQIKPDLIINLAMWSQEDIKSCAKIIPANIEFNQTEILTKARAIENRAYTVFCNFADSLEIKAKTGRIYQETSIGGSMIINPYGEIIAKTDNHKEQILFAELDLTKSHWSKYNY
ncbi:carbon-nitrogen hydrolase family protein [Candidatus Beckwithbacteria bacterium]|nr:carbon-nitrogen hydrolase family protein [Candidatus Beckwithbacteria bacterium]